MRSEKRRDEGGCDNFRHLPDGVVLDIFNKLMDAKWLCRCSIVSKRFASLIPQIHTVSITNPFQEFNSVQNPRPESNPPKNFLRFLDQIVAVAEPSSAVSGGAFPPLFRFLKKLKEIRFLSFELPSFYCEAEGEPIFKWMAKFGIEQPIFKWKAKFGTKLETVMFLLPTSLRRMQNPSEIEKDVHVNLDDLEYRFYYLTSCLLDAYLWHAILLVSVAHLPSLRSVSITDSKKHGKLCVSGEQLVELANSVDSTSFTSLLDRDQILNIVNMRLCYVRALRLPFSGYVVEEATVFMVKLLNYVDDDDAVIARAFVEEEGTSNFKEAVREILTRANLWRLRSYCSIMKRHF